MQVGLISNSFMSQGENFRFTVKMDFKQKVLIYLLIFMSCLRLSLQVENISSATMKGTDRFNFGFKDKDDNGFSSHVSRNRKNHKHLDPFEDILGLDSKLHESSDRKYVHEHEGFFFPIPVPHSHHHDKEDHILIPILLIILIPLLLFAIIIPLNANLLSTLFLIMQNNGVTTTTAQLAPGRRKKRSLYTTHHPIVEEKIFDMLEKLF
ncbi:UNVERIFIED_CONTAM: hypothetical protein NCL1_10883 [Trichonephila clavipes]